jgi:hypothetical protein
VNFAQGDGIAGSLLRLAVGDSRADEVVRTVREGVETYARPSQPVAPPAALRITPS